MEAAPWVVDAAKRLEAELAAAYDELRKQRPIIKAVFDRDVWMRAERAQTTSTPEALRLMPVAQLE